MITMSAIYIAESVEFANWRLVDQIVRKNLNEDMQAKWVSNGYEGLCSVVPEYFGMTRMYRNNSTHITFEFTEEQWTVFLLRWA